MGRDLGTIGPIDFLIVEFPTASITGEGIHVIADLVDRGLIRVIDLRLVRKEPDGTVVDMEISEVADDDTVNLDALHGESLGLINEDDLYEVSARIEPGHSAGILVFENLWAGPLVTAMRREGGQLVATGRIPVQTMFWKLTALEAEGGW